MIRVPERIRRVLEQGGTLVVPSRQRAHAARLGYAAAEIAAGRFVWPTPDILPFEGWLVREIERHARNGHAPLRRLLSPAEEWFIWQRCTAEVTRDLELLSRAALADALRQSSALAAQFRIDLTEEGEWLGAESQVLAGVQRSVDTYCRSLGAATRQTLVDELPARGLYDAPLVVAGFLGNRPRFRCADGMMPEEGPHASVRSPRVVVARDGSEEIELIAEWCHAQITRQPDARLLVILPGPAGPRERLAALIRQTMDARSWMDDAIPAGSATLAVIEGGAPLSRYPLVAQALVTLALLNGSSCEFEQFSEWLRAAHWLPLSTEARARADIWLRSRGQLQLDLARLKETMRSAPSGPMPPGVQELTQRLESGATALAGGYGSPREWSERCRAALDTVGWPGETLNSDAQQTVVRFHELLDEFGQLALSVRALPRDEAIQWLTELTDRTQFRPADEDAVVTLSGAMVDPVVQYDGIWVAGLYGEAFPLPVQPDPFIPLSVQLSHNIPQASAAGRLAEARALLNSWHTAAAEELVLSAPARMADLELPPSALLTPWLEPLAATSGGLEPIAAARTSLWLPLQLHRDLALELLDDPGLTWPAEQPLPSGTRALELQNTCPFRAYAELRLGSTDMEAPEPGIAPDTRGRLLHAALERLWCQLRDQQTLASLSESALHAHVVASVQEAAATVWKPSAMAEAHPAVIERECRRAVKLIHKLCLVERERTPFRVEQTEFETTLRLESAHLQVRMDRVDVLEDGGRAVLDYKSGGYRSPDWYSERPSHPQLLAYLAATGADTVALATVSVTAREVRFSGVADTGGRLPQVRAVKMPSGERGQDGWEICTRQWRLRIEALAQAFVRGHAAVNPKPGACDYCHVIGLCRISDRALDVLSLEAAESFEARDD